MAGMAGELWALGRWWFPLRPWRARLEITTVGPGARPPFSLGLNLICAILGSVVTCQPLG